jgi:hypothetical protein
MFSAKFLTQNLHRQSRSFQLGMAMFIIALTVAGVDAFWQEVWPTPPTPVTQTSPAPQTTAKPVKKPASP